MPVSARIPASTPTVPRPRFSFRLLRYFTVVCEEGSFRAAASRLNIAQSALSRHVAHLEGMLGVRLLERHHSGVIPTEAGAILRKEADAVAETSRQAIAEARDAVHAMPRQLSIALTGTISELALVPALIASINAALPGVSLNIVNARDIADRPGEDRRADITFRNHDVSLADGTSCRVLLRAQHLVAVAPGHRLADSATISVDELLSETLIVSSSAADPVLHEQLLELGAATGRPVMALQEIESEKSRMAFAAAGIGAAIVSPMAAAHAHSFGVVFRAVETSTLSFVLSAQWHADLDGPDEATAALVIDLAAQTASRLSAISH